MKNMSRPLGALSSLELDSAADDEVTNKAAERATRTSILIVTVTAGLRVPPVLHFALFIFHFLDSPLKREQS
jgi:hypothetical protein